MNGDYGNYERFFYNSDVKELTLYEPCYLLLNKLFLQIGFSFSSFMVIYSLTVLSLVYFFVSTSRYPALFSALYFLNFIMEYVFMRNYLANALFLVFIIYCARNIRYKKIKIFILLLLASMFHVTALMYIMFIVIISKKLNDRSLYLISVIAVLSAGTVYTLIATDTSMLNERMSFYIDDAITPVGPIIMHLILVLFSLLYYNFLTIKNENYQLKYSQDYNMMIVLKRFNIISLAYIPAYIYIPYMTRFFRVLFPINIYLGLLLLANANNSFKKTYCILYITIVYALMCYRFSTSSISYTFDALFMYNKIFHL